MLRSKLLATTFLIIVGSFSFSPVRAAAVSRDQPGFVASVASSGGNRAPALQMRTELGYPGRDRNTEFLCTYGYKVYLDLYSGQGSSFDVWVDYAVPIRGKGVSVSEILVTDAPVSESDNFKIGIHKDNNGKPGTLIADGIGEALGSCLLTTVVIPKTLLAAGRRYWVVEKANGNHHIMRGPGPNAKHEPRYLRNAVNWGYKPDAKHNALYQSYYSAADSWSLSDWLPVSGPAPFVKVQ
jgi:hypothetical protein